MSINKPFPKETYERYINNSKGEVEVSLLPIILVFLFVGMSVVFDFKGDIHNANNSMLWAIWSVAMLLYFRKDERK